MPVKILIKVLLNGTWEKGGLGIRNLSYLNKAYSLKLGWRLLNENTSLWSQFFKEKYFPNKDFSKIDKPKNHHNGMWKNIVISSKILKEAKFWILGNGRKIRFWDDKCVDNLVIRDYVTEISTQTKNYVVADFINWNNRSWDIQKLTQTSSFKKSLLFPFQIEM